METKRFEIKVRPRSDKYGRCVIYWGDGSKTVCGGEEATYYHDYDNTGDYKVSVIGAYSFNFTEESRNKVNCVDLLEEGLVFIESESLANMKVGFNRIPDSVSEIGYRAFSSSNISGDIEIPSTVKNLGEYVFNGCDSITNAVFSDGFETVPEGTFFSCARLTGVRLPDSIKHIGDYSFAACNNLWEFSIPSGVVEIGEHAFSDSCLNTLEFPDSLERIGKYAFAGPWGLYYIDVEIPPKMKIIEEGVFFMRTNIASAVMGDGVEEICESAFDACENLSMVDVKNVKKIGYASFRDCSSLKDFRSNGKVESIGDNAFKASNITSIDFPSVTSIGIAAFTDCANLSEISLNPSIEYISNGLFAGCNSLVEFPYLDGVVEFGDYVFGDCTSLERIYVSDLVSKFGHYFIDGIENVVKIIFKDTRTSIPSIYGDTFNSPCEAYVPDGMFEEWSERWSSIVQYFVEIKKLSELMDGGTMP